MVGADGTAQIDALMGDYFACWNAKDTLALATRYYCFDPSNPLSTEHGVRTYLDKILAQGFDHVVLNSLQSRLLASDEAQAHVRYTHFTAKGEPIPLGYGSVVYTLHRLADGWRIVNMRGIA